MTISDWIPKDKCYWLSRIEFQVTDYLGLKSKSCDWLSRIECKGRFPKKEKNVSRLSSRIQGGGTPLWEICTPSAWFCTPMEKSKYDQFKSWKNSPVFLINHVIFKNFTWGGLFQDDWLMSSPDAPPLESLHPPWSGLAPDAFPKGNCPVFFQISCPVCEKISFGNYGMDR